MVTFSKVPLYHAPCFQLLLLVKVGVWFRVLRVVVIWWFLSSKDTLLLLIASWSSSLAFGTDWYSALPVRPALTFMGVGRPLICTAENKY